MRYELGDRGLVVVTGQVQETSEAGKWRKTTRGDGHCGRAAVFWPCFAHLASGISCCFSSIISHPTARHCCCCAGVESNGAGKTALTMAPLWALTGSVDSRAEVQLLPAAAAAIYSLSDFAFPLLSLDALQC